MDIAIGGAGGGVLTAGLILLWRLYVEVRRDRDLYREKFFEAAGIASLSAKATKDLVKLPKVGSRKERLKVLAEIADLIQGEVGA